ncbi:MAG TPA: hypothetical protein VLA49_10270 [Anaerolineales bacterium]|nr:hypothetical protein [Anaerolineales bacterium]
MEYTHAIQAASNDPESLEELYQAALQAEKEADFQVGLEACYATEPENLLYAAWHYRLQSARRRADLPGELARARAGANWKLAVPLGIVTGLIFWAISDEKLQFLNHLPYLFLLWAPIATLLAVGFLTFTARKGYRRAALVGLGLLGACLYVLLVAPGQGQGYSDHYLNLAAIHLPLLSWIALGLTILGLGSSHQNRFAFLIKSVEVAITAGVYLIAGVAFGGITIGMFAALSIELPEVLTRLIAAGGFGLIPILAVTSIYDPGLEPASQDFSQGLSKFIATMMRLLLPLTFGVLVIYLFVIPFNFLEPFRNRDVLIIYNVMLFAIMGLLMGATPIRPADLSERVQAALRNGILAVAILAVLVSLYALSATLFRTVQGGITINRLTILGWNTINIAILGVLIYRLFSWGREKWAQALQATFSQAANGYILWSLFILVAIPLLFR